MSELGYLNNLPSFPTTSYLKEICFSDVTTEDKNPAQKVIINTMATAQQLGNDIGTLTLFLTILSDALKTSSKSMLQNFPMLESFSTLSAKDIQDIKAHKPFRGIIKNFKSIGMSLLTINILTFVAGKIFSATSHKNETTSQN